jgi:uncharacterized protein YfaQ (DUF2300 family)
MRLVILAATAVCFATAAQAQSTSGAPMSVTTPTTQASSPSVPAQVPAARPKKDPIICKHEEEMGSRLGGKSVCMTKSQWDDQAAQARQDVSRVQTTPH